MANNTIAERIINNLLEGKGYQQHTRNGFSRYAVVDRLGRRIRDYDSRQIIGWRFDDGSKIMEYGEPMRRVDDISGRLVWAKRSWIAE
jgi:hypothetical protein